MSDKLSKAIKTLDVPRRNMRTVANNIKVISEEAKKDLKRIEQIINKFNSYNNKYSSIMNYLSKEEAEELDALLPDSYQRWMLIQDFEKEVKSL
ncbi:hypothetical protein [Bacteroides sp. Phil13]|uniref:hypothetical protein n=1 Tax=Bacteroides sp. Phil13 TaxID=1929999 RepID=UPI00257B4684|nr:hypothetical protein [Bacteroides sp. Phil13]